MERINLPHRPLDLSPMDACIDYSHGGFFARVILEVEVLATDFRVWAQAFEVDQDANYIRAPKGYPSRSTRTPHTIPKDAITTGMKAWTPGWAKILPPPGMSYGPENLPEGVQILQQLPASGTVGDQFYVDPWLFAWTDGVLREIAETKVRDLETVLASSTLLSGQGFDQSLL